ncbi:hypothetical protein BJ912DRAFT_707176 [Pholiota molesta]|nr:hypothetical protein BJ912DRAFT_707176 [Pholiota molesta]
MVRKKEIPKDFSRFLCSTGKSALILQLLLSLLSSLFIFPLFVRPDIATTYPPPPPAPRPAVSMTQSNAYSPYNPYDPIAAQYAPWHPPPCPAPAFAAPAAVSVPRPAASTGAHRWISGEVAAGGRHHLRRRRRQSGGRHPGCAKRGCVLHVQREGGSGRAGVGHAGRQRCEPGGGGDRDGAAADVRVPARGDGADPARAAAQVDVGDDADGRSNHADEDGRDDAAGPAEPRRERDAGPADFPPAYDDRLYGR